MLRRCSEGRYEPRRHCAGCFRARWRAQRDGCPSPGQFIPFGEGVNHHRARQISAAQMRQDQPIRIHRGDL